MNVELIGYVASVFVGISLLMSNMKRLRYINLIGCLLFTAYGIAINAYPVALMNAFCAMINVYHIFRIIRTTTKEQTVQ